MADMVSTLLKATLDGEELVSIQAAARKAPGGPCATTVWRWAKKGVPDGTGGRLKLEAVWVGGLLRTSHEAVLRFLDRRTASRMNPAAPAASPGQAPAKAAREL